MSEPLFQVNGLLPFSGMYDAFVTKIDGTSVVFSTYLGGSEGDVARGIRVDSGGMYIVGETQGTAAQTNDLFVNVDSINAIPISGFDTTHNGGTLNTTTNWIHYNQ